MISRIEEYRFYKRNIDKHSVKQNERGGQLEECAFDNDQDTIAEPLVPHPDNHHYSKGGAAYNR